MSASWPVSGAASALLRPAAWIYGAAVGFRNRRYERTTRLPSPIPVISVGNLTAGGTGKTPVVEWIVRRLLALGRRPAIVSRGYGGNAGKGPVLVSAGEGPLVPASRCGDEPWLLALRLRGTLIVVGSDRSAGVEEASSANADVAVLDDGFQHRRVPRTLDLVLLDADSPVGNGRLFPAGPLREPPSSVARADAVLLTRWQEGENATGTEALVRRHNPRCPILRVPFRPAGFVDALFEPAADPGPSFAFCGIGNPVSFRESLEAEGVEVLRFEVFRDHHPYLADELGLLYALARRRGATLVTTEKDLARMEESWRRAFGHDLRALRVEAAPLEPDLLDRMIAGALRAAGG